MHRHLKNQIQSAIGLGKPDEVASTLAELASLAETVQLSTAAKRLLSGLDQLLQRVDSSYEQYERDLELRTRHLKLSSDELATAAAVQHELEMQKFAMDQHAIISITDRDGAIIYANELFCKISGYELSDLVGKNHRLINSGFHPPAFFQKLWQTILSGQVWRGEVRNRNRAGKLYWVAATIVPMLNAAGEVERFIAIRTDITNRKLVEAAMEESRSFLQGITDTLGDGVFRLDDQLQCEFINPEAEHQLGLSLLELIDQPFFEYIGLCDDESRPVDCRSLIENISVDAPFRSEELFLRRRSGEIFPISLAIVPLGGKGNEDGWVGSFRDISERKFIQDALQVSERRLSVAFDAAETFLWEWNLDSGDGFVSDNFYQLLGYSRGDIVFQWNTVAGLLHADDVSAELDARHAHLSGEVDHYTVEHRLRLNSGDWRWFCSTGKITAWDEQGQPLRFTGIAYDIHERKRAQEELAAAKSEADRANHMKGQFLANMSHELRTPLNAVIGLGHIVQQSELQPQQRDYLQKMESASQHLLGLINDILDYSKIESGKLTIESIPLSPAEVVREVVNLLQPKAQNKNLLLMFKIAENVPQILLSDRKRLSQVLLNLTDNALKFTERGEVHVGIGGQLDDTGLFKLRVDIRDQGIGLTSEQIGKLFKPFVQADGSTARRFGGTGLGLAICRELVELMGGHIGVDSEVDVGSTFYFELPCQVGKNRFDDKEKVASTLQPVSLLGYSVLVVEDDYFNQEMLRALLESWGMSVEIAGTGDAALSLLSVRTFDIVLQDLQLPDIDGDEIVRHIRNELELTGLPIIALTGNTEPERRAQCLDIGFNDFVTKPYDFDLLLKSMRRLLGISEVAATADADQQEHSIVEVPFQALQQWLERIEPLLLAFDPDALELSVEFEAACKDSTVERLSKHFRRDLESYDFVAAKKSFEELKNFYVSYPVNAAERDAIDE